MATFKYKIKNREGTFKEGTIDAANQDIVLTRLRQQGVYVVSLEKQMGEGESLAKKQITFNFLARIRQRDIMIFTRQFATLISSGMSLIESLATLEEQCDNPKFKKIISQMRNDIESGYSLSEALQKHEKIFRRIYVSLVRAGEAGGVVDVTLENMAKFLEKEENMRLKINNKTAYPKFVMVFAVVITFVIIVFMVPTFQDIYDEIGATLPVITQVIIFIGNLFKKPWFYAILIGVIVGGKYLFRKILTTPSGRSLFDKIKISLPKFGTLIKTISFARLNRQFEILLKTGVPILTALDIIKGVSDNIHIDNALLSIKKGIREGENMSEPMARYSIFPPMMVQMIAVGERTGNLDTVLEKIADFYEDESSAAIDTMITVLEPMMLLVVALIIGMIVISMYLPMFNVYQNM